MKKRIERISTGCHTYTVCVGGALDGVNTRDPVGYSAFGQAFEPNRFVRMENTGDDAVINPWITVNGRRDWRSIDRILDEILDSGMDDAEKARAGSNWTNGPASSPPGRRPNTRAPTPSPCACKTGRAAPTCRGSTSASYRIREVLEETGVRTKFEALVCFRHWHGYRYGKSDIYFVCRLSPLNHDITAQEEEIEECLWMPVEDYLTSEYVHTFNRQIVRAALNSHGVVPTSIDGYSDPKRHEIFMPPGLQEL